MRALEKFLRGNGFKVRGFQMSKGYWSTRSAIEPPGTWDNYKTAYDKYQFVSAYALNESTALEIANLQQKDESAVAILRIRYNGCTPVCAFVKAIWKENPELGFYIFYSYFPMQEWPEQEEKQVSYTWNPKDGWRFSGIR